MHTHIYLYINPTQESHEKYNTIQIKIFFTKIGDIFISVGKRTLSIYLRFIYINISSAVLQKKKEKGRRDIQTERLQTDRGVQLLQSLGMKQLKTCI